MTWRAVACLILVVAGALAQQRRPCFGRLVDATGQAIANAAVTCVHTPYATEPSAIERMTCSTDERGRFRFDLAVGLPYCVWGIGPADTNGRHWVTAPRAVGAGATFELGAPRQVGALRLSVSGSACWRESAPLTLRVFPDARQDCSFDVVLPGDGAVALPPLPLGTAGIALCGRDGAVTQMQLVRTDAIEPAIDFLPPAELTVQVNDAAGKPVDDAEVEHLAWKLGWQVPRWRSLGRTDPRGQLRTTIAWGPAWRWPWPGT
jgi:hypothetical protein